MSVDLPFLHLFLDHFLPHYICIEIDLITGMWGSKVWPEISGRRQASKLERIQIPTRKGFKHRVRGQGLSLKEKHEESQDLNRHMGDISASKMGRY